MSDKENEECEGIRQGRETDKEIKAIRDLISDICTNSEVNKLNLEHMTISYKELATANSLTHYKLFSRTEKLLIAQGKLETSHNDHVKHEGINIKNKHNRYTLLVAVLAIGVSLTTAIVLAIQAGVFK